METEMSIFRVCSKTQKGETMEREKENILKAVAPNALNGAVEADDTRIN
jgi:hypothetical protein